MGAIAQPPAHPSVDPLIREARQRARRRRLASLAALLALAAGAGEAWHFGSGGGGGGGGGAPATGQAPPAANQIATFAKQATPATAVSAEARTHFIAEFSFPAPYLPHGVLVISTIDLSRLRRFTFAPHGYSVIAAPTRSGLVYWLDASGGANVAQFAKGSGMAESRRTIDGAQHTVIRGIAPDGIAHIRFDSQRGSHFLTAVRNNVFEFVAPATLSSGIKAFAYITTSGHTEQEQPIG
ncbi:MAG TPA: hypothetical protein VH044_16180 [Polyangiaceae bacterium]|nr:hypothetical protein [Polyangiaceae bacterium]